jgi:D-threo-aldose 1-dehydrogenase
MRRNDGVPAQACETCLMVQDRSNASQKFSTTRLGFGVAGMFHEPSKSARERLLLTALEMGVVHFDVAPIYGLGEAQGEVGKTFKGRRDDVVIATKVGIGMTRGARLLGRAQGPVRALLQKRPQLQQHAKVSAAGPTSGLFGRLLYTSTFEPRAAQRSLDRSLRELGTHIDLLLLHDPEPCDLDAHALSEFLENARASGKIRWWGVAGEFEDVASVSAAFGTRPPIVQIRDDIFSHQDAFAPPESDYVITFGTMARAFPRIHNYLSASATRVSDWSEAVGQDLADPRIIGSLLMKDSLQVNAGGTVLISTTRPERIRQAATVANNDPISADASLERFRELVRVKLPATESLKGEA